MISFPCICRYKAINWPQIYDLIINIALKKRRIKSTKCNLKSSVGILRKYTNLNHLQIYKVLCWLLTYDGTEGVSAINKYWISFVELLAEINWTFRFQLSLLFTIIAYCYYSCRSNFIRDKLLLVFCFISDYSETLQNSPIERRTFQVDT